jgi:flagellar biosynthesis protein FlhB
VKSEFKSLEMVFLGHVLSHEGVRPNLKKIELIKEWQNLSLAKRVRSFLGLANFYKKFIKDFLALAKLFIDLLKKEGSFGWKGEQQKMFDLFNEKLLSTLVL